MVNILEKYLKPEELAAVKNNPELLNNLLRHHLVNPIYKAANFAWQRTQVQQIIKGAEKYPEPLNPESWTPKQLIEHALQENVDQVHYLVSLGAKTEKLQEESDRYLEAANYWMKRSRKKNDRIEELEAELMRLRDAAHHTPLSELPDFILNSVEKTLNKGEI